MALQNGCFFLLDRFTNQPPSKAHALTLLYTHAAHPSNTILRAREFRMDVSDGFCVGIAFVFPQPPRADRCCDITARANGCTSSYSERRGQISRTVPSAKTVDLPLLHSLANISVMQ